MNIVVTGGSKGIGAGIVKFLASKENNIVLNYNKSEEEAKKIQKELLEKGINIEIFKADVSQKAEATNLIKFCIEKYKSIDVLINNAGIAQKKLFTEITEDDWQNMLNNNLSSAFYTTQAACKNMIKNQKGCIINISSIWGVTGGSCEVHYSATKAGIDGMTKALAKEIGLSNIRVNSIAPGIIETSMNKNLLPEEMKQLKEEIPLNKIGNVDSIAKCVKWLISDDYTTGQVISINGGWNI